MISPAFPTLVLRSSSIASRQASPLRLLGGPNSCTITFSNDQTYSLYVLLLPIVSVCVYYSLAIFLEQDHHP